MIVFIISGIILIVGTWHCIYYDDAGFFGALLCGFISSILGTLIGVIILLFVHLGYELGSDDMEWAKVVEDEQIELFAMKDNFGIDGTNYMFSSYLSDSLQYIFLYEDPVGIRYGSADAEKSYIKFLSEDEVPYLQKWHYEHKNSVMQFLFFFNRKGYTFYLPEGSVIENVYNIDLE